MWCSEVLSPGVGWTQIRGRSDPGRHPVSSSNSRAAAFGGRLALFDPAHRDLPAPRLGDKTVSPQQQHLLVAVDSHSAGPRSRVQPAVLEMLTIWQLDVRNPHIKPVVAIE